MALTEPTGFLHATQGQVPCHISNQLLFPCPKDDIGAQRTLIPARAEWAGGVPPAQAARSGQPVTKEGALVPGMERGEQSGLIGCSFYP